MTSLFDAYSSEWYVKRQADCIICVMVSCACSQQMTKRYELDFRERAGRMGYKVQTSVKNFQMTLEVNISFVSAA